MIHTNEHYEGEIFFHYYIRRQKKGAHGVWVWCWI